MRILTSKTHCNHCGANLEYNSDDVEVDFNDPSMYRTAPRYISCPICHHRIYFD